MPKIPNPLELDEDLQEKQQAYTDVLEVAESVKAKHGNIPNPLDSPVPGVEYDEAGFPKMPKDLTAISSRDLGRLFQALEAFDAYFRTLATDADVYKMVQKEVLDLVKAKLKHDFKSAGIPDKEVDELIKLDPRFIKANSEYLQARAIAQRIEDYKSIVSRRYNLVSREITRRGNEKLGDPDRRFSVGQEEDTRPPKPGYLKFS